jgi:protein-arginine kinase activator protein McsA
VTHTPTDSTAPAGVPDRACPTCGLTAAELRDTGRMGCAACYDAFPEMVARAVEELHHSSVPAETPPPLSDRSSAHPWPTRRARDVS